MARIFLDSSLKLIAKEELSTAIEKIFQQLEDQFNKGADLSVLTDDNKKLPAGIKRNDIIFNLQDGQILLGVFNGKTVASTSITLLAHYKGQTISGAAAAVKQLPMKGDFCFHHNTVGGTYTLATNFGGVIKSVTLT